MFTYRKILSLIECRHNWFLKMLKQYITPQNKPLKSSPRLELKKHVFTIILFYFLYAMTCLDTVQKTFPKKCVNSYDRWEKTSSPEFQLKGKYQSVPNTFLQHIANEKDIFSKLNRYISKISLKYIKLYNREILFLLPLPPPPQAGGRGCMSWKCGSSNMTNDDVINDYN